ncbi:unnamed protein product [Alopecurus aequalis]
MPPKKYRAPRLAKAADPCKTKTPRKQRAPQSKPEGWTNSSWAAELNRRAVISGERRKRLVAQKARDAAIAAKEATREEMMKNAAAKTVAKTVAKPASSSSARATMRPPPPIQHQVLPPQHHQLPPMHQQLVRTYLQAMWPTQSQQSVASPGFSPYMQKFSPSPEYVDGDPHGGFNPNTAFAPTHGPPSNLGIDINNAYNHSPTYSGTPSPHGLRRVGLFSNSVPSQFDAEMDDMITVGSNATAADPGYMDTPDEDEDIVALDTQTTFGEQSEAPTGETQDEGEDPAPMAKGKRKTAKTSSAEPHIKWATKEDECLAEAWMTVSIDSIIDGSHVRHVPSGQQRRRVQVPARLESCEKWKEVRLALAKTKDGVYNPDTPTEPTSAGRPEGNKKAKAAKAGAPTAERVQAAIEQCIADAKDQALANQQMNAEREEKANARWAALMKKSDVKIELLKTNVAAKRRMTDLTFLQAGDPTMMTPQVAAWYKAECGKILNGMPAAPSADEVDA